MLYRPLILCFCLTTISGHATENLSEDQRQRLRFQTRPPSFNTSSPTLSLTEKDLLFKNSPDFVCTMSLTHLKKVNETWAHLLGWRIEELYSLPLTALIHPEDFAPTMGALENVHRNAPLFGFENRFRTQQGNYRSLYWVSLSKNLASSSEFFGVAHDLTLEKHHAAEIERLNQTLQRKNVVLTAADKVGSVYYKADSKDLSHSPAYRLKDLRVLQVMAQTFMNLSFSQACCLSEVTYKDDQPSIEEGHWYGSYTPSQQETLKPFLDKFTQESINIKEPLYQDQFLETYTCLVLPMPIDEDKFVGFTVLLNNEGKAYTPELVDWLFPLREKSSRILEDMALQRWKRKAEKELEERRAAELRLERENREKAEEANRIKTSFVSHMSHEIRTPLNSIMGFLELAQGEAFSEQGKEYLFHAQKSAKSLLTIANDILDMARIDSHTLTLHTVDFNIHQLAQRVIRQSTLEAQSREIPLTLSIDSSVPQVLKGDNLRFQQILSNLISNALKFTRQGKIEVHLQGQSESEIFHLQGKVQDTGIGMEASTLARLFQPFSQGDASLMRQFGGTGLGLYITKQLCHQMKGDITATSASGIGSTFTFDVQLERTAPTSLLTSQEPPVSAPTVLPPLSVLVAEDNLMNQKVIRILLERLGCKVDIAINGQEALEATSRKNYDVILMDGEMPVMDGLEATRRLRQHASTKFLPIIGVSAHAMPTHAHMFLEAGMNGYLAKPVKKEILAAEIQRCLALQEEMSPKVPRAKNLIL